MFVVDMIKFKVFLYKTDIFVDPYRSIAILRFDLHMLLPNL
jgi:hypothetical protein